MESSTSEDSSEPSAMNIAFIKRLKIAVATTIIRNKPSNVSAKEYTESLARKLRQKEDNWRSRARRLEDELLKTKQELALVRLKDAGIDVQIDRELNWDDENDESASQEMEEQSSASAAELAFPTPPCSSDDNVEINQLETTLKNNALFLHGVSQLKSIPAECNGSEINQTILDTAIAAIQHVENFAVKNCHGPWNHGKLLKDAVKGVVGLLECKNIGEYQAVLDSCIRFVDRLLTSLVEHNGLNNNQCQHDLCQLVTMLGRTEKLQIPVLHHILQHLQETSTMLRRTQEAKQALNYVLIENAFYLCSIFEDVLFYKSNHLIAREHGQFKSILESSVILELHEKLENCLLHVSREYPLYAQFIWRLTGALECMQVE